MTDHFNHNPNLFTASGCLSGPALEMKAKGLLTGKDLDRANEHLNGCGFCSDALEGLQIWLASQTERGEAVIKENYSPGKTEFVSKPVDFNTKISQLNERLLRKMEAGHPPIVEKSRRMPVYGWVAIAASLLLFVGIYLTLDLKTVRPQQPLALEKEQPSGKSEAVNTLPDSVQKPIPESPPAPGNPKPPAVRSHSESGARSAENRVVEDSEEAGLAMKSSSGIVPEQPQVLTFSGNDKSVSRDNPAPVVAGLSTDGTKKATDTGAKVAEGITVTAYAIPKQRVSGRYGSVEKKAVGNNGKTSVAVKTEEEVNTPFTIVEQMPEFPGGSEAMNKFLSDNLHYPSQAEKDSVSGTVYLRFVVETSGRVSNIKVLRGIGGGCDEEAVRVVKLMPDWIPGRQNGKKVDVQFTLPIRFRLNR